MKQPPDARWYFWVASYPLFSAEIWAGERAPLALIFFKALALNPSWIAFGQAIASMMAWCFLGVVVVAHTRSLLTGIVGMSAVLGYSLTDNILVWHGLILSESLNLSLMVALIGSWVLYLSKQTRLRTVLVLVVGVAFVFVRDTNAYMAALIGVLLIIREALRCFLQHNSCRRSLVLVAVSYCVIFLLSVESHNAGKRWVFPFYNVISQRILTSHVRTQFFESRGMPINAALRSRAGKWAPSDNRFYFASPQLEEFRAWAQLKGRQTYIYFLLSHPAYLVAQPMRNFRSRLTLNMRYMAAGDFTSLLPGRAWNALLNPATVTPLLLLTGMIFAVLVFTPKTRCHPLFVASSAVGSFGIPYLFVAWHGDAMEVARHCFSAILQMEIAVGLAVIVLVDCALETIQS